MDIDIVSRREFLVFAEATAKTLAKMEKLLKGLQEQGKDKQEDAKEWATAKTLAKIYDAHPQRMRDIAFRASVRTIKVGKFIAYNVADFAKAMEGYLYDQAAL